MRNYENFANYLRTVEKISESNIDKFISIFSKKKCNKLTVCCIFTHIQVLEPDCWLAAALLSFLWIITTSSKNSEGSLFPPKPNT